MAHSQIYKPCVPFTNGFLIAVEGIDGSGKSSFALALKDAISSETKRDIILSREPGGTDIAEQLRGLILQSNVDKLTELMLFLAARADHVNKVILPALSRGHIVIVDRYMLSTLMYQGIGREIDANAIKLIQAGLPAPDLTVIVTCPLKECLRRIKAKGQPDRFETSKFLQVLEGAFSETTRVMLQENHALVIANSSELSEEASSALNQTKAKEIAKSVVERLTTKLRTGA